MGIRRAARPRNGLPESIVGSQSYYPNFLSSVANAISAKSMFHVFYSPRYYINESFFFFVLQSFEVQTLIITFHYHYAVGNYR